MARELERWKRFAIGCFVPLAAALACWTAYGKTGPPCVFHELTGLYCPGCGSGRAVSAALHGRFLQALTYNPLLVFPGLPALAVFFHEYLRLVFPKLGLKPVTVPQRWAVGCTALVLLFWIARNLPAFGALAPGP